MYKNKKIILFDYSYNKFILNVNDDLNEENIFEEKIKISLII